MLKATHQALEKFDNQHDFERMSADILNKLGYKNVIPIAPKGGSDDSKDITFLNYDGEPALACVSLRKDANTKIMSDLSARKKGEFTEYTFFTNQYLTSTEKKKITKFCLEKLDAQFVSRDIELLRSLLDTNLKSIRKNYLHIDNVETVEYSVKATEIRRYSLENIIEIAEQDLQRFIEEDNRENRHDPFGLALLSTDIFTARAKTMVKAQQAYLEKLNRLSAKLDCMIGFNLEVSSSVADEHIEVIVSPSGITRLGFDVRELLPEQPSRYNYGILKSVRNFNTRDHSEFYATFIKDTDHIKSNLEKINSNHPKLVFDEDTFAIIASGQDFFEVEAKIFSKLLPKPQVNKVKIKKIDSILEQLK